MANFSGLFATPVTAYDKNGNIDSEGIKRLVEFVSKNEIQNLFCLGSWGGFALMDDNERKIAAKGYLDAALDLNMPCIVNIASTTPKKAIDLAKHAQDNGASAIASLVPYYYSNGYKEQNIISYFDEIVSSVEIPVHFYNNPRTTGLNMTMPLFRRLIESGISGMKEGGGNLTTFIEMMSYINKNNLDFDMIPGSVTMLPIGLLYGVQASMIGSAIIFPALASKTWKAWEENNIDLFVECHMKLMQIRGIQSDYGMSAATCYKLLELRQVSIGKPRSPWIGLDKNKEEQIQSELRTLSLPI